MILPVDVVKVKKVVSALVAEEAVEKEDLPEVKYCDGLQLMLIRSWVLGLIQVQYVALDQQ